MARKKHRHESESAAQTLDAMESYGDRFVQWISENPVLILGTAVAILVVAGIVGLTGETFNGGSSESAAALARAKGDYQIAMGATPGSIEIPEPANAETATRIRSEAVTAYEAVASQYPGTTASSLALLEAAELQQRLGQTDAAVSTLERALESVDADSAIIRAMMLSRLASIHEAAGRFAEAGARYAEAGGITQYPLHFDALADAARTFAQAGDRASSLAAYQRIRTEAPDFRIAPYVQARLDELESEAVGR